MKFIISSIVIALISQAVYADDNREYCDYAKEKAHAESILQKSPQVFLGGGRDGSSNSNVIGLGIKESLSGFLKSYTSEALGQDDCQVYRTTNQLQTHIEYDLTNIQLKQVQFREEAVSLGIKHVSELIAAETIRVNAGVSTKITLSTLQAYRAKLEDELANLKQREALTRVPVGTHIEPVSVLISQLVEDTDKYQHDLSKQAKYDNWDVAVTTGVGSDPSRSMFSTPNQRFTNLQFTYSLGGPSRSRALDSAADHYTKWTQLNNNGPVHLASQIREQVQNAIDAAKGSKAAYDHYRKTIQTNLDSLEGLDTAPAHSFRIQLQIEQTSNDIESSCNEYTVNQFTNYLNYNFKSVL